MAKPYGKQIVMKNMLSIVIVIILFSGITPVQAFAQNAHLRKGFSLNKSEFKSTCTENIIDSTQSHFSIKMNPLQWLWDDIRVMLEVPINKNNSLQFRIGYRNSAINPYDKKYCREKDVFLDYPTNQYITYQYKVSGYNAGISFNHYFKNNYYIAPSFLYKRYRFYYAPPEHWWFYEHFEADPETPLRNNFIKSIYAVELRCGKVLYYKRWLFDFYAGCGFRMRSAEVLDIYNNSTSHFTSYNFPNSKTEEAPTFHAGVNIGFCL